MHAVTDLVEHPEKIVRVCNIVAHRELLYVNVCVPVVIKEVSDFTPERSPFRREGHFCTWFHVKRMCAQSARLLALRLDTSRRWLITLYTQLNSEGLGRSSSSAGQLCDINLVVIGNLC